MAQERRQPRLRRVGGLLLRAVSPRHRGVSGPRLRARPPPSHHLTPCRTRGQGPGGARAGPTLITARAASKSTLTRLWTLRPSPRGAASG
eukprot:5202141-Alexandrium_andersonii.AAC.1